MATANCPHCGGAIQKEADQHVRFCPYCGKTLEASEGPSALEKRIQEEKKPKKKYEIIMQALAAAPDDFDANKALLYHGRLHEPMHGRGQTPDYSIIKAYLLNVFQEPEKYTEQEISAKLEELLRGEQLQRVLSLAPDADAFFAQYLTKLAHDYVDLFIRGDSRYSRVAFGFPRSAESTARSCAAPVRRMLMEINASSRLTAGQRLLLLTALREGFARTFAGFGEFLDD